METLKNYLENMFLSLPNTPEVRKAKSELGQMMEDKYTELKNEGKAENEAIGIVISEFGNLDEVAEELGIKTYVEEDTSSGELLCLEDAKAYLKDAIKCSQLIALGVMLCIISPTPFIFMGAYSDTANSDFAVVRTGAIAIFVMFFFIGLAVAFFICAGVTKGKWQQIKRKTVGIDFHVTDYTKTQYESLRSSHALCLSIGCMFCILSFIPVVLISAVIPAGFWVECSAAFLFILVAIGVYLIVFTANRNAGYQSLLSLNAKGTIGNIHVPESAKEVEYTSKGVATVMSVYWQTVTCIYLCVSFISFDWHITWIIWPVAAVLRSILNTCFQKI